MDHASLHGTDDVFAPWAPPGTRLAGPGSQAFHAIRSLARVGDLMALHPNFSQVLHDGSFLLAAPSARTDLPSHAQSSLLYPWPLLADGPAPQPAADPRLDAYWEAYRRAYDAGQAPCLWWQDTLDRVPDGLMDGVRALNILDVAAAGLLARGVTPGRLHLKLLGAISPWPEDGVWHARQQGRFVFSHQGTIAADPSTDPAALWLRRLEAGLGKRFLSGLPPVQGQRWGYDQALQRWTLSPASVFSLEAYVHTRMSLTAHQAMAYAAQAAALTEDA